MGKVKENSRGVWEYIFTFLAVCITYYMYMKKYLSKNTEVMYSINVLFSNILIDESKRPYVLISIAAICLFLFLIVGYVIYRTIFKTICKCKVKDSKLLLSVMIGYALSFLAGYFLVGLVPLVIITVLCNLIEAAAVFILCYDEIKNKTVLAVICRTVLVLANIFVGKL